MERKPIRPAGSILKRYVRGFCHGIDRFGNLLSPSVRICRCILLVHVLSNENHGDDNGPQLNCGSGGRAEAWESRMQSIFFGQLRGVPRDLDEDVDQGFDQPRIGQDTGL